MRGCECATCEGGRAYKHRPESKARNADAQRRYRLNLSEAEFARQRAADRARERAKAERRDTERVNHLRRAA